MSNKAFIGSLRLLCGDFRAHPAAGAGPGEHLSLAACEKKKPSRLRRGMPTWCPGPTPSQAGAQELRLALRVFQVAQSSAGNQRKANPLMWWASRKAAWTLARAAWHALSRGKWGLFARPHGSSR